jgi:hypothetical protein
MKTNYPFVGNNFSSWAFFSITAEPSAYISLVGKGIPKTCRAAWEIWKYIQCVIDGATCPV